MWKTLLTRKMSKIWNFLKNIINNNIFLNSYPQVINKMWITVMYTEPYLMKMS